MKAVDRTYVDGAKYEPGSELPSGVTVKHDYEPGDQRDPMHTDPLCRVCGQPKKSEAHR